MLVLSQIEVEADSMLIFVALNREMFYHIDRIRKEKRMLEQLQTKGNMKRRMKANADKRETGYHSREHDEDPTCHKTHEGDTPCEPVESDAPNSPTCATPQKGPR